MTRAMVAVALGWALAGTAHAQVDLFGEIDKGIRQLGEGGRHLINEADKIIKQVRPVDIDFRNGGVTTFNWGGVAETRYDPRTGSWQTGRGIMLRAPEDLATGAVGQAIRYSRERARATSRPVPLWVQSMLAPFFSPDVLNNVRYTYDWGATANLTAQATALGSGKYDAIALVDTIVFRNSVLEVGRYSRQPFEVEAVSWESLYLWAHELTHLEQYRGLGIEEFGRWLIRDYDGNLENPAQANGERVVNLLAQTVTRQDQQQCTPGSGAIFAITHPAGTYYLYGDCNANAFIYDPQMDLRRMEITGRILQYGNGYIAMDTYGNSYWAQLLHLR